MEAKELSLSPEEYAKIKASVIESLERTYPFAFRLMEAKELLYEKILSPKEYAEIEASVGFYSSSSSKRKRTSSSLKHVPSQNKKSKGSGYRIRF